MGNIKIPDYRRAARQRLEAAEALFALGKNLEAMYLGGYVIECSLKALILQATPPKQRERVLRVTFTGKKGHSLEALKELLHKKRYNMSSDVALALARVRGWSTELRYRVGIVESREAQRFLEAVKTIFDWAERCQS